MPILKNQRHERFCQSLAKGKTATDAYEEAGYTPNRRNAWILKTNQDIIDRIAELHGQNHTRHVVTRQYVIEALIENAEKALGRKPVKLTRKVGDSYEETDFYVYEGNVANQAIRLAGIEVGMFVERKEVRHISELSKLSDVELLEVLVKEAEEAQQLLEYHGGDETPETSEE